MGGISYVTAEHKQYMSLILRHKPETIGITLDEHGWANVDELIAGINQTRPLTMETLEQIVREDEVGVKLFERGARKITLTNEGMLLRRRAEEILALVDRTQMELVEQDQLVEGRVVVGCGRCKRAGKGSRCRPV